MITPNQAIFLYHLRQNPDKRVKIRGKLTDGGNGRCALGLGCEAFGIDIGESSFDVHTQGTAYTLIAEKLGVEVDVLRPKKPFAVGYIYGLNDAAVDVIGEEKRYRTFAEIADEAEKMFEEMNAKVKEGK